MKVRDLDQWELQKAELIADGETGQRVLEFLTHWAERAEELMESPMYSYVEDQQIMGALRGALLDTEAQFGIQSFWIYGQMLVLLIGQWAHHDGMLKGMTVLEQRLVQEVLTTKLADMQEQAANQL